jgi:hypothetical protein
VESFFTAARAHALQAMLDCFDAEGRAAESGRAGTLSRRLAAPGVEIASYKLVVISMSMTFTDGVRTSSATAGHTISFTEGGGARTLSVTFRATQSGEDWYLTEVKEGAPPPGSMPFDEMFKNTVREVGAKAAGRNGNLLVLDLAGAAELPAAGTRVDVLRVAGAGEPHAGELVQVASGLVNRVEGTRVHVDVDAWTAGTQGAGAAVDAFKKGAPLKLQWPHTMR